MKFSKNVYITLDSPDADVSGPSCRLCPVYFPAAQTGADLRWEKVSFSSSHETEYRWRACISGFLCLEEIHVFVISR